MVLTIAAAIFVFGLLVLVHELGHFITAKLTGMRVDEFAIGFGPKLVSFKHGETAYSIRAVPLGGFNDIAGMDPEDKDAGDRGYSAKPVLSRMIVIIAGSAMNLILPIFLFFGIYFFSGVATPSTEPVLGRVIEGEAADKAGLQDGDRILAIDGKPVETWTDLLAAIRDKGGETLSFRVARGGEEVEAQVTPVYDAQQKRAMVGVMGATETRHPGFAESVQLAVTRTAAILYAMAEALYKILLELSGAELAGPLGVAQMAGEVAQMGFVPLLNFAAFLSLNLGLVNLFPIPALDGGHFLLLCVEAVRGKPLGPKAFGYVQRVGIALLLLLMLFATKNDIMRVFFGS
ncbi:RIP metalloprotease RseP [Mitsuokella sp. oral taxon 131]|uniref:RIP metalloprotease RseP n=1 Tax=Mitsuokella sp. oral taxon 131 TaxID=1321780 RepID=UPI0003AE2E92|nr:RIP metalloprotease RseP [Mitsuokella sp. oral taxon 131]ERL03640.1 RIP metalloprotease RseP [Mitsuokella sp. oral taxon 131 str. W9106]